MTVTLCDLLAVRVAAERSPPRGEPTRDTYAQTTEWASRRSRVLESAAPREARPAAARLLK